MTIDTAAYGSAFADDVAADPGAAGAGPRFIRVSVLSATRQVDVGIPADVPVAALMTDLIALIGPPAPADPAPAAHEFGRHWVLARIGSAPLSSQLSLSDNGIHEGELLVLRDEEHATPPPLFDDVVDAIAALNTDHHPAWGANSAHHAGRAFGVVAAIAAAIALASCRLSSPAAWPAALATAAAITLVTASAVVARTLRDRPTGTALSLCAAAFAASAGMLLVPGDYAAEHILLAAAMTGCVATLSYRVSACDPLAHTAVITSATLVSIASAISVLWQPDSLAPVGALLATGALLTIACAPRLTILLAHLPLPPVPNAGDALDPADIAPRPTIAGIGAVGAMALPAADVLAERVALSRRLLTGIVGGATTAAAAGATVVLATAEIRWPAIAFVAVIAAILVLQCRTYSDRTQAAIVLIGGSLIGTVLVFTLMLLSTGWALAAAGAALTMSIAALVCGIWAPTRQFSPVMRRTAEVGEYLLIGSVVPLTLWVMDVYQLVRDL